MSWLALLMWWPGPTAGSDELVPTRLLRASAVAAAWILQKKKKKKKIAQ